MHPSALRYFDPAPHDSKTVSADLCIYGGVSGGVVAAVEAVRRGLNVVLLESGSHLGGMTSGGLSCTDLGTKTYAPAIGGLSLEFYRRAGRSYGVEAEWYFEPHIAEQIFEQWLVEMEVPVFRRQFLATVEMDGDRIAAVSTVSGLTIRARMFIDASYEGDLMALAGVSHHVGREGAAVYGEKLAGSQIRDFHQFDYPVDPYVVPGVPQSGVLFGIETGGAPTMGAGDHRIQAYNFRMCLTRRTDLRVAFARPAGYDPSHYLLLKRYLLTGWNEVFAKFDPIRNGKVDMNNHGAISTDFIGMNYAFPQGDYRKRETIFQEHVRYQQGLLWCLANDPDIPPAIRDAMSEWGLCRDEFIATDGWPHALYIRESRRMVSDHVMTEHYCRGIRRAQDSVGLAAHGIDSHNCRRLIQDGRVWNEGDVQVFGFPPYPVSYRSLIPKRAECTNLLVTFCLSASHIAFGSIRMEPVLMVLSQSAAIAAAIALKEGIAVQDVPYPSLRHELLEAGQVLSWESAPKIEALTASAV